MFTLSWLFLNIERKFHLWGTQTFPKLQIRSLGGRMELLKISLFSVPPSPTHMHITWGTAKKTQKWAWPSSGDAALPPSFFAKGQQVLEMFSQWFLTLESETQTRAYSSLYKSWHIRAHMYQGQWVRTIPVLISHHYNILIFLSCVQCSRAYLCWRTRADG